jgi:hypothetical protein
MRKQAVGDFERSPHHPQWTLMIDRHWPTADPRDAPVKRPTVDRDLGKCDQEKYQIVQMKLKDA